MSLENHLATGHRSHPAGPGQSLGWRLALLLLVLVAALAFIGWIKSSTWARLADLQQEFATVKTESFYLGIRFRSGVAQLNEMLLRFQLSKADRAEQTVFHEQARELRGLLIRTKQHLHTAREKDLAVELEKTFNTYLTNAIPLLERGGRAVRRDSAEIAYNQIQDISAPLLHVCNYLAQEQSTAWGGFLQTSEGTLASLRRLSQLSILLLAGLILATALLLYRALILPLRHKLRLSEVTIARQEKLASLGTLAAGVAHEIRNPLTAVKFRLFSLKNSLPDQLLHNEDVVVIGQEILRLERIVQDFLAFARPAEPRLAEVRAQDLLRTVTDLMQGQLARRSLELHVESSEPLWLQADEQQMEQVLINLVQNAAESIDNAGRITLRAVAGEAQFNGATNPAVILEVSDTGKGMPLPVQSRLFDPFFSTKAAGTGLGLSIAERIVTKHGGRLQFETEPERGTTFQIVLPRAKPDAGQDIAN